MERVGIRVFKDHLSQYVARVRKGAVIVVTDHGVPVARLSPADGGPNATELHVLAEEMGVSWAGGKPQGLRDAPGLLESRSLARAIAEDRSEP